MPTLWQSGFQLSEVIAMVTRHRLKRTASRKKIERLKRLVVGDYVKGKLTDSQLEQLQKDELNTCDKCGLVDSTYDLIWITSEDFEPKKGEKVPESAYRKYDALCKKCYGGIVKRQ
jgi:hypothetical protein